MSAPIAIPSHDREPTMKGTLAQVIGLEGEREVAWYVPNDEFFAYRRALPGWMRVIPVRDCVTVSIARNAIHADYAGGDVGVVEDDVPFLYGSNKVFYRPDPPSTPRTPRVSLTEGLDLGFRFLDATGLGCFGLYPVNYSGVLLHPIIATGHLFLVGHVLGLRLQDWDPRLTLPVKEDYQLTALAIERWGKVARLELLSAATISGKEPGGTKRMRETPGVEAAAAEALVDRWPGLFRHKEPTAAAREGKPQVKMVGPKPDKIIMRPEPGWRNVYEEGYTP